MIHKASLEKQLKEFMEDYWKIYGEGNAELLLASQAYRDTEGKLVVDTLVDWLGNGLAN